MFHATFSVKGKKNQAEMDQLGNKIRNPKPEKKNSLISKFKIRNKKPDFDI
jgi:hypothetical protein